MRMIYNSSCSKSNCALELAQAKGIDLKTIDYLGSALNDVLIDEILHKSNLPLIHFIRTNEDIYLRMYGATVPTETELRKALMQYPVLLQRPIVLTADKAYIARDSETLTELFS